MSTNLRMSNIISSSIIISNRKQKDDIIKDKKQIYYNYKKYIAYAYSKLKIQITI